MLKQMNVDHYRFSISWARILPNGQAGNINQKGIDYYNNLINELLANNITPFVSMYHWELPQELQRQDGWLSDAVTEWFTDYARILFKNFGDRVKYWTTINEPKVHCHSGYGIGEHAPAIKMPGIGNYICGRNVLLAHARAWHVYNNEFRATQNGQIGISIDCDWAIPSTNSTDDINAFNDYMDFTFGQFMHPIFSTQGNYPQNMIDRVALVSSEQGYLQSRLRPFSVDETNYIKGTADFLGLNHYSSYVVYRNSSIANLHPIPSMENDAYYGTYQNSSWPATESDWLREYPEGLYNLLLYINKTYNSPTIYITENGVSAPSDLNDDARVRFHRGYLEAVLDAIDDGVNVQGYAAWSLMDNFEWIDGYTVKFGLYRVDFNSKKRTRTARRSALVYKDIVTKRYIDYDYNPVVHDGAFTMKSYGIFTLIFITFSTILRSF